MTVGEYTDCRRRRVSRRVQVSDARAAARELALFAAEVQGHAPVVQRDLMDLTMNEAVDLFLTEYLTEEKGRDERTIEDYREIHRRLGGGGRPRGRSPARTRSCDRHAPG